MNRFYSNGVFVEAVQFKGNFSEIESFVGGDAGFVDGMLVVATPEGPLRAKNRDWIIKKSNGRISTCEPFEFMNTHSPVISPGSLTPPGFEKIFESD